MPEPSSSAADPIGEGRTVQGVALASIYLRLGIQRQMIGVFGDDHMARSISVGSRLDDVRWRRGLHDRALTTPAGLF